LSFYCYIQRRSIKSALRNIYQFLVIATLNPDDNANDEHRCSRQYHQVIIHVPSEQDAFRCIDQYSAVGPMIFIRSDYRQIRSLFRIPPNYSHCDQNHTIPKSVSNTIQEGTPWLVGHRKASKRPITIQLVMIKPMYTDNCLYTG
jgi:hypothetical protein